MQVSLKHLGFFVAGCTLGFGSVYIAREGIAAPTAFSMLINQEERGGALASLACVPQKEDGDIFFVTCGGIY